MGTESNLKSWVSDKLIELLSYSQPTVIQYVIGLAKQASAPGDVVGKLLELGLPSSSQTRAFAEDVFARVPRNLYKQHETEAALLARKQKTYALLDADDEDEVDAGIASNKSSVVDPPESRCAGSKKKRFRKKNDSQDDEDEEEVVQIEDKRRVKRRSSQDEDDGAESEERLRDQREGSVREEFKRAGHSFNKEANKAKIITKKGRTNPKIKCFGAR